MAPANRAFLSFPAEVRILIYKAILMWPFKPMLKVDIVDHGHPFGHVLYPPSDSTQLVIHADYSVAHGGKKTLHGLSSIQLQQQGINIVEFCLSNKTIYDEMHSILSASFGLDFESAPVLYGTHLLRPTLRSTVRDIRLSNCDDFALEDIDLEGFADALTRFPVLETLNIPMSQCSFEEASHGDSSDGFYNGSEEAIKAALSVEKPKFCKAYVRQVFLGRGDWDEIDEYQLMLMTENVTDKDLDAIDDYWRYLPKFSETRQKEDYPELTEDEEIEDRCEYDYDPDWNRMRIDIDRLTTKPST
jgi:hypothetical protein